ncbi:hypothetical protein BO83DRAFT_150147 [Aspergillus eucalypticola CBS 122712]|uniref:Uncharacterized protein n=1 Tax=Aspergillus eucalypticola (strain CBS 122712 / IBT 29274) TaxID=1448314 RepID=A0A317UU12_ASPEC|nr:uncharacterized protein BO83DRAFT_150147 [Aspergillus eucalypticola CBS 122712]PWY64027.1 hypothetical protein BO83DRAFT_150147 [Aspergillus eucalypticola CBS 122712]
MIRSSVIPARGLRTSILVYGESTSDRHLLGIAHCIRKSSGRTTLDLAPSLILSNIPSPPLIAHCCPSASGQGNQSPILRPSVSQ